MDILVARAKNVWDDFKQRSTQASKKGDPLTLLFQEVVLYSWMLLCLDLLHRSFSGDCRITTVSVECWLFSLTSHTIVTVTVAVDVCQKQYRKI
jgi:hypothetical protein